MTATVANTANTNTFDYWRNRTNELAYAMSQLAVTVNSNTAVGNAAVSGNFIANSISVGNSTVNVHVFSPSASESANGNYFLNANGSWSTIAAPAFSSNSQTSGGSAQLVDNYSMTQYNVVEYIFHIKNNNANGYMATKLFTMHDTSDVLYTEYSTLTSNVSLGSFSANANSTHVRVYLTPTSSNTSVNFVRLNV